MAKRPGLTEEQKYQAFEQKKAKRYVDHITTLHPDCRGCNIGRKWVDADLVLLFSSLRPGVTFSDLSLILDRPVYGISSKLRSFGFLKLVSQTPFVYAGTEIIRSFVVAKFTDEQFDALIASGWTGGWKGALLAPNWWALKIIRKGYTMRKDD